MHTSRTAADQGSFGIAAGELVKGSRMSEQLIGRESRLALVVEDSSDQLTLLQRMLEREGYSVFAAINAEAAIAAFDKISPSVAIVDLMLPGLSGAECATLVRKRFPDCAIIISSVLDVASYPESDAALPKPVTGASLHEVMTKVAA